MRDQILATPGALKGAFWEMEKAARLILTTPEIYGFRRMVLCGSGDSFFAGKAAELAFLAHGGVAAEVRPPMEAGRYHATLAPDADLRTTLVICVSNSGAAARVAEAAIRYRKRGAFVLAVTKNPESRLARAATRILPVPVPSLPEGPGYGPFLFALAMLYLVAIRIGEVRMARTMDEAQGLRHRLAGHLDELAILHDAIDGPCRTFAETLEGCRLVECMGSGPNLATAQYGAAKLLEAAGRHALAQDLEEWVHLNYFDAAPEEIASLVTAPAGAAVESRALEIVPWLARLGRNVLLVGGGASAAAARSAGLGVLEIESGIAEVWSPLLFTAPSALVAAHLAELTGAEYGRGAKGRWIDCTDAATVQQSLILED